MLGRGDYSEKRGFNRMGVECLVILRGADGSAYSAMAQDLSATGLQVAMTQPLEVGTELELTMRPEKTLVAPLEARVEVVRVNELAPGSYEVGLSIKEIRPIPVEE